MITVLFLQTQMVVGGAEMVWAQLIEKIDRKKFRPLVCCLYEAGPVGERLKSSGVQVFEHLSTSRWDLKGLFRLAGLLRSEKVDILYMINQPVPQLWGTLAGKMAGVRALSSSIHSTGKISRIRRRLLINRFTFPFVKKITCLSESHKKYLIEQEGINPAKLEIVTNGIDLSRFDSNSREEYRKLLGVPADGYAVGILAMLRPEKAHDVFLKTAQNVLKEIPKTHFFIVGDGPERQKLEALAKSLGIEEHIHFLGVRNDVHKILQALDVAVLSSHPVVETLSIAVLEYMAAARPVVATRVGSTPELVKDGESGFLFEPGDSAGLAKGILQLLRDPDLARRMGEKGRQKVASQYTADHMVQQMQKFLENLVKN